MVARLCGQVKMQGRKYEVNKAAASSTKDNYHKRCLVLT
jgi:hypothetical protein